VLTPYTRKKESVQDAVKRLLYAEGGEVEPPPGDDKASAEAGYADPTTNIDDVYMDRSAKLEHSRLLDRTKIEAGGAEASADAMRKDMGWRLDLGFTREEVLELAMEHQLIGEAARRNLPMFQKLYDETEEGRLINPLATSNIFDTYKAGKKINPALYGYKKENNEPRSYSLLRKTPYGDYKQEESYEPIDGGTLPVAEYTAPKEDSAVLKEYADNVRDTLNDIHTSKGYQRKLSNEVIRSGNNKKGDMDEMMDSSAWRNSTPLGLLNQRMYRSANTPVSSFDKWNAGGHASQTPLLGRMSYNKDNFLREEGFYVDERDPRVGINTYHPDINKKGELRSTLVEELEHASHVGLGSVFGHHFLPSDEEGLNITPYAKKVIKDNGANDDRKDFGHPSEVIAKKRATEVYLIDKGLIKPGGRVLPKHLEYLESNYNDLPTNVQQFMIEVTNGKRQAQLNIMNKIAANDQQPQIPTARYGMRTPYMPKARNGMMMGDPPPDGYKNPLDIPQISLPNVYGFINQPEPNITRLNAYPGVTPLNAPSTKTPYTGNPPQSPTAQGGDVVNRLMQVFRGSEELPPHVGERNEPEITLPQQQQAEAAKKGYDPTAYFDLAKTLDTAALFRNMVQGPPPTIQSPITHMPRVHYDRTILDQQKQNAKEAGMRGMYEARQQLGQAGDIQNLMLGYNAQQQQAMSQLGTAEREMGMQERLTNTQIAGQEQQMQDQQNLQENQTNYQIMQQAQHMKDRAVEHQLSNIAKDVKEETQYNVTKEAIDKQQAIDKEYKDKQQRIGLAGVTLQAENMYRNSPDYQTGLQQQLLTHAQKVEKDVRTGLMADPTWQGRVTDADVFTGDITGLSNKYQEQEQNYAVMEQNYAQAEKDLKAKQEALDKLVPPDPNDVAATNTYNMSRDEYTKAIADAQSRVSMVDTRRGEIGKQRDEFKRQYEVQGELMKRIQNSRDYQGVKSEYDAKYRSNSPVFALLRELGDF